MGNCLSKDQAQDVEDVIETAAAIAGKHVPNPTSTPKQAPVLKETHNLLSDRPDMDLKAEPLDPKKTAAMLDMGIQVVDLFQKVAKATEVVLPSPLGDVLEKVTSVLGVLKKMVENRLAWRQLLDTIDDHQKTFNEQLMRLKAENMVPDPESPLLGPVIQYSDALEKLAAEILTEGCLKAKDAPESPLWDKIKTFTTHAIHADDEQGSMDGYRKQLDTAMEQFMFALGIFVSFTVEAMAGGIKALGEGMKEVRDMMALPRDTTNTPNITEFGGQHKKCLEGTRVEVLEEIRVWAGAKESSSPVYCIADVAGTGKSTVALTMYDKWRKQGSTPLAFFFSQGGAAVHTATDFCFFLKKQIKALGVGGPELDEYWKTLEPTLDILRAQDVEQQWTKLVYEPLCMLPKSDVRVLLVDALDECTSATRGELLRCILSACSSGSLAHIRIFITTRNEPDIRKLLQDNVYSKFIIQKTLRNSENAKTDVAFYVNHRLDESGVFESTPEQRRLLIDRCDGLFIFAFLACQLLEQPCGGDKPLEDILKDFTELDSLYYLTLSDAEKPAKYNREVLTTILGVIVTAREPLSITAIATLLPTPVKATNVQALVGKLGSILGSGGVDEPVYILHATFREFLLRQVWVTKQITVKNVYAISQSISNRSMARSCLKVLIDELKKDSGERPSVALRYAAMTWISHITPELHIQDICDLMRKLFEERLLNWIEFGAVHKVLPQYMLSLGQLQVAVEKVLPLSTAHTTEDDVEWCRAILEFLRLNNTLLLQSDDSVYSSCIIFTPDSNLVHRHYGSLLKDSIPNVILGRPQPTSGSVVLTGHDGSVFGVQCAFYTSTGDLLVSAAGNQAAAEIMVWDVQTGAIRMTYTPKGQFVYCFGVAFLPGNKEIVSVWSGHGDQSVWQLWRVSYETGDLVGPPHPLKGEGDLICIAWAHDWSYVLCGTKDGKIFRFSMDTGEIIGEAKQAHGGKINTLSFSPDGLKLVSTSADNKLKVWDATSEQLGEPIFTLDYWLEIYGAAFCPTDPSLLAAAAGDALHIYNITTGTLDSQRPQVNAFLGQVVYSPDGKYIATQGFGQQHIDLSSRETRDGEVVIEGTTLETGHTLRIGCMTFSPDNKHIVTGAYDQTLRIAKLEDVGIRKVITGHQAEVVAMAFTPDGKQCATVDDQAILCLWDLETGELIDEPVQCQNGSRLTHPMTYSSDAQDIVSGSSPDNIVGMTMSTKAAHALSVALRFSGVVDWTIKIRALAMAPDDSSLAIMGSAWFEEVGEQMFLCIKHKNGPPDAPVVPVDLNITSASYRSRLGYHPSGDYICCGDYAWELATELPALVTGDNLATILKEAFPVSFECSYDVENQPMVTVGSPVLTTLTFGSPVRQTLSLPPELLISEYTSHDGRIALGSNDGRVTVLDFTHLLTPEETALLSRIRKSSSDTLRPLNLLVGEMRKISLQRMATS